MSSGRKKVLWILVGIAILVGTAVALWRLHAGPTGSNASEPIRISGVAEPPELLIPPHGHALTKQERKYFSGLDKAIRASNPSEGLRQLDELANQYPDIGDFYSMRAMIHCSQGDISAAKADIEQALATNKRLIIQSDKNLPNEMLAMRAKIEIAQGNEQASLSDIRSMLSSYISDIGFLSGGVVKLTDKPSSPCNWTATDLDKLLLGTKDDPNALIFSGLVYSSLGEYDQNAIPLAEQSFEKASTTGSLPSETKFYTAVGFEQSTGLKRLGYSDSDRDAYNRRLIELYSAALQYNPKIERAYAARAEAYSELKDWERAISDYDEAIRLDPPDYALWNDRGLSKEETFDKNGAISDYTQAIQLKSANPDDDEEKWGSLVSTFENRGDLYAKLGEYQKAAADYSQAIGQKFGGTLLLYINLERFRAMYPEYNSVDDNRIIDKLHRMYFPNFTNDDFRKTMYKSVSDPTDMLLSDTYLKRADAYLALKDFSRATADYKRSTLIYSTKGDYRRWRTPPGLAATAVDLQTLRASSQNRLSLWARSVDANGDSDGADPTEYQLDCANRKIATGDSSHWIDPAPSSREEAIRDYFCR